jgi:hypothetical protein
MVFATADLLEVSVVAKKYLDGTWKKRAVSIC